VKYVNLVIATLILVPMATSQLDITSQGLDFSDVKDPELKGFEFPSQNLSVNSTQRNDILNITGGNTVQIQDNVGTDTNASTECSDGRYLAGNGSCLDDSFEADTVNPNQTISVDNDTGPNTNTLTLSGGNEVVLEDDNGTVIKKWELGTDYLVNDTGVLRLEQSRLNNTIDNRDDFEADTVIEDNQNLSVNGRNITLVDGGSVKAPYAANAGSLDGVELQDINWSDLELSRSQVTPEDISLSSLTTDSSLSGSIYDGTSAVKLAVDWQNASSLDSEGNIQENSIASQEIDNDADIDVGTLDVSGGSSGDGTNSGLTVDSAGNLYISGDLNLPGEVNTVNSRKYNGSLIPDRDSNLDIGNETRSWRRLYLSDQIVIGAVQLTEQNLKVLEDGEINDSEVSNSISIDADGNVDLGSLEQGSASTDQVLKWDGSEWIPAVDRNGTDNQELAVNKSNINDEISLSNGGSVTIEDDFEPDTVVPDTNASSACGDNQVLTGSGCVSNYNLTDDGDTNSSNEIQGISASGDTISIYQTTGESTTVDSAKINDDINDTVQSSELEGVFAQEGLLKRSGAGSYTVVPDDTENWSNAYSQRGSEIDGRLLNWNGSALEVRTGTFVSADETGNLTVRIGNGIKNNGTGFMTVDESDIAITKLADAGGLANKSASEVVASDLSDITSSDLADKEWSDASDLDVAGNVSDLGELTTSDLQEGSKLYFTSTRAQNAVSKENVSLGNVENIALSNAVWSDLGINQQDIDASDVGTGSGIGSGSSGKIILNADDLDTSGNIKDFSAADNLDADGSYTGSINDSITDNLGPIDTESEFENRLFSVLTPSENTNQTISVVNNSAPNANTISLSGGNSVLVEDDNGTVIKKWEIGNNYLENNSGVLNVDPVALNSTIDDRDDFEADTTIPDTNASSACRSDEVLKGDGNCVTRYGSGDDGDSDDTNEIQDPTVSTSGDQINVSLNRAGSWSAASITDNTDDSISDNLGPIDTESEFETELFEVITPSESKDTNASTECGNGEVLTGSGCEPRYSSGDDGDRSSSNEYQGIDEVLSNDSTAQKELDMSSGKLVVPTGDVY